MTYQQTTNELLSQASLAMQEASNTQNWITVGDRPPNVGSPSLDVDLTKPDLGPPPAFDQLFQQGDGTKEEMDRLNGLVDDWLGDYFPNLQSCFKDVPDDWLCDVVSGVKPFGLDASVFEIVWQRARDRSRRTMVQERRDIEASFSQRGFRMPPGAMAEAMVRAQERASDDAGDVNREQAVQEANIKNELLQFAVGESVRYKNSIMQSLAQFVQIWSQVPNQDIERARIRASAYSALYNALSTYYGVEQRFEELKLEKERIDAQLELDSDANKIAAVNTGRMQALGQAVRAFGDVAANAANAASTLSAEINTL